MEKAKPRYSISRRFFYTAMLPVLLSFLLASGLWSAVEAGKQHQRLKQQWQQEARQLAATVAAPLWNLDQSSLTYLLDAALQKDYTFCVVIVEQQPGTKSTVQQLQRGNCDYPWPDKTAAVPIRLPVDGQQFELGTLQLHGQLPGLGQIFLTGFLRLSILLLGFVLVLLVSFSQAFKRTITQPLHKIISALNLYRESGRRQKVAWTSQDEIGALVALYNQSIEQAEQAERKSMERHQLLEKAHRQVRQALEEIEQSHRQIAMEKARADKATQAKSRFVANMSHEIRTPLHAVMGLLELLRRTPLTEQQQAYIDKMEASTNLLLSLVNDILDLAKIEAGKLVLEHRRFNLLALLNNIDYLGQSLCQRKDIQWYFELFDDLPEWVMGDELRLSQVLMNLISNACKFTSRGHVRFSVQRQQQSGHRIMLAFHVEDTGVGIDPAQITQLFNAFEQQDSASSRRYGGTGLGLTISKQLVDLMGGEIQVHSEPGKGSHFEVALWLEVAAGEPLIQVEQPDEASLAGRRILVVEDNPINQEIAAELLRAQGAEVTVASDGQEAIDSVARQLPDIILMDIQMPGMDGYEACRRLRQQYNKEQLVIIAMTANATREDREMALDAGMNDFISKPVQSGLLVQTLCRYLQPQRLQA